MSASAAAITAAGELGARPGAPGRAGHVLGTRQALLDEGSALLASRVETAFLAEAGWDPATWVLTIDPGHRLLGRQVCRVPGCQTTCPARTGVCLDCRRRLAQAGLGLQDYGSLPPPRGARWLGLGEGTCSVTGCPRPWVAAARPLCPEHLSQQQRLGAEVDAFTARPGVTALPSHGVCAVAACPRQLPAAGSAYCDAHLQRLRYLRRAGQEPDEAAWRLTEPPVPRSGQVSLAGLNPAAVTEILFGLQQRTRQGVKTHDAVLRSICNDARSQQVSSLAALAIPASRGKGYESVVNTLIMHARRGMSGPETETAEDIWDMALFGHGGGCRSPRLPSRGCGRPPRSGPLPTCRAAAAAAAATRPATTSPAWRCCPRACASAPIAARTPPHWDAPTSRRSSPGSATCTPPGRSASSPVCWPAVRSASCWPRPGSSARPGPADPQKG